MTCSLAQTLFAQSLQATVSIAELVILGVGLLMAWFAYRMTRSLYGQLELDRYFKVPWRPLPETGQAKTPIRLTHTNQADESTAEDLQEDFTQPSSILSIMLGIVAVVTVLLATLACIAYSMKLFDIQLLAQKSLKDLWVVTAALLLGLALARWVAGSLLRILEQEAIRRVLDDLIPNTAPQQNTLPAQDSSKPPERFSDTIIRVLGLLIYAVIVLPIASMLAEYFGWITLKTTIITFWEWLLSAGQYLVLFGIVYLGISFIAVTLIKPELRGRFMIGFFILGVIIWGAISSPMLALGVIVLIAVIAWWGRHYVPDLLSGLYLMTSSAVEIPTTGGIAKLKRLDPLLSRIRVSPEQAAEQPLSYLVRNQKLVFAILYQQPIDLEKLKPTGFDQGNTPKLLP